MLRRERGSAAERGLGRYGVDRVESCRSDGAVCASGETGSLDLWSRLAARLPELVPPVPSSPSGPVSNQPAGRCPAGVGTRRSLAASSRTFPGAGLRLLRR